MPMPSLFLPPGATQVTATSGNAANATATATIAAVSGRTNYLTGFDVTGSGATAGLPAVVTVSNLTGGTITYTYTFAAGALVGNAPLSVRFPHPIPATGQNTAITVACGASGAGGTNNVVTAYGYFE